MSKTNRKLHDQNKLRSYYNIILLHYPTFKLQNMLNSLHHRLFKISYFNITLWPNFPVKNTKVIHITILLR